MSTKIGNMALLIAVRDAIADEANLTGFDMGEWFLDTEGEATGDCEIAQAEYGECGTVACIAGHTVGVAKSMGLKCVVDGTVSGQAANLLGTGGLSHSLFYGHWHYDAQPGGSHALYFISREDTVRYLTECIEAGEFLEKMTPPSHAE